MLTRKTFILILFILAAACTALVFWSFSGDRPPFSMLLEKPDHYDVLIKNAAIADGSGKKTFKGDIAVTGDRIARVGSFRATADLIIDAKGLVAAPGFINPHSHIDQTILKEPEAGASLAQGVTTEIVGTDGQSAVDLQKHFAEVSQKGPGVNYGSLAGQGSIRQAVIGQSTRPANEKEIASMKTLVKKAMEDGAFGLSTGLEYIPGVYTPAEEIIQLAKAVHPYKGVYVSHIRNEKDGVVGAVKEALEIGKAAGIPAIISHIKVGSSVYDPSREQVIAHNTGVVLEAIHNYRKQGGKVYADIYPYRVPFFMVNKRVDEVYWRFPPDMILVSASSNKNYWGKTIGEIAAAKKVPAGTIAQELSADPQAKVCINSLSQASIDRLIREDFTMIGMDNVTYWPDPSYVPPAHPRNYGTYPKILAEYVREKGLLELEEAVHKMTGLTAQVYGIPDRGFIREGYFADLVIFDPERVADRATYAKPTLSPEGILHVIVNGQVALSKGGNAVKTAQGKSGGLTGIRAGKIIKSKFISQ